MKRAAPRDDCYSGPSALKPAPISMRSRLMEEDREGEPAGPAADWSDYAMAAVVAAVMLGIPLLAFLFR